MPYKIELNLYYVRTRSFLGDIYLIAATFLKIFGLVDIHRVVKDEELLRNKEVLVGKIGGEY